MKSQLDFNKFKKIYFVGIGGWKVSYLAQYFKFLGKEVYGANLESNYMTDKLKELGIKVFLGKHKAKNLDKDTDLVVYSLAIPQNNPELKKAKKLKISIYSAPEIIGQITKNYYTICIAGTHGKGTTTALTGLILEKAGFDPLVFVGMAVREFGNTNIRIPKLKVEKRILVLEADEWKGDFLNYDPDIIAILNIDFEHPDSFKNINDLKNTYKKFIIKLKSKGGILIINEKDRNIRNLLKDKEVKKLFMAKDIKLEDFSLSKRRVQELQKYIRIPGKRIFEDYLCAYRIGKLFNIRDKLIFQVFSDWQGALRRFEIKFKRKNAILIDDYAHNPQKIEALIEAVKEKFRNKKISIFFQPHQGIRTYYLANGFIKALSKADKIYLLPIYYVKGREIKNLKISSQDLILKLKKAGENATYLKDFTSCKKNINKDLNKNYVVITAGAGDIWKIYENFDFGNN